MQHDDGFVYCYGNLYGLMLYWGVITFRVQSPSRGGAASTGWTVGYALLTRLLVVSCFLGCVFFKLRDPEMSAAIFIYLKPLDKVILSWECLSCTITYVEYCLSMDAQRRRHLRLLAGLQEFDRIVSKEFPFVKWNYQRTRWKYWYGTVIVGFCFFSFTISLIFDTARCTCGIPSTLLMAFTYTLLTSSVGLVGFVHIAIMDFVRLRMRLMQKLLQQQYQEGDGAGQRELHERIAHLFVMSKRCSSLLAELNGVFGFAAAAGIFYDFTIMTCFVYVICQKLLSRDSWDLEYMFMLLHVAIHSYKVIITSTYGYLLQREKRNCLHMLGNYASHFSGQDVARLQTEDFQHWRMHNRQAALVGSSIQLNISTIYLVYNGMANYVIILVQLLFQQLQIKERQQSLGRDVDIVGPIGPITHMD
ncbi:hypothetical protein KR054_006715 [Drosophila jambulina]|nr:hypothetical protein KR054_006715 [Drosophila jambulina]